MRAREPENCEPPTRPPLDAAHASMGMAVERRMEMANATMAGLMLSLTTSITDEKNAATGFSADWEAAEGVGNMRAEMMPGLDRAVLAVWGTDALTGCSPVHDTLKLRMGAAFTEAKKAARLRRGSKGAVDKETHA